MPLPFLLRRSRESRAGLFRQSRRRHLLYGSPPRKPHGSLPGHWRFCATQPEAGKLRGFSPEPAGDTALWLSVPETAQPIAGALWGRRRFRITQPEAGKPRGFSVRARWRH